MATKRAPSGHVNVKKGASSPTPPPGSQTARGVTPSSKLPTTRPAGNPNAPTVGQTPGKLTRTRPAPGTLPNQVAVNQRNTTS